MAKIHQFYRDNLPPALNAIVKVMSDKENFPEILRSTLLIETTWRRISV